jgi:regulator of protease activity HflC (stomatin/prohibitin superfamily)
MAKRPAVHSRIVQKRTANVVRDAVSILSTKSDDGEIPLVLVPAHRSGLSLMMQVPTGVFCLAQKFGQDMGEIEPGLHILPSWWRIAYVVSKQACSYDAPVRECPTQDDVRVNIDVVIVFQIVDASKFIYKLGCKNFDEYLSGTVDEAIRILVRQQDHKTVYELRGEKADIMLASLNEKFQECGVSFIDVKIVSVWLPEDLQSALEETTKMEKAMEKMRRKNEFELMQISQESEMAIEQIKRTSEQEIVKQQGKKKRCELQFEQDSVKTEQDGKVALIQSEGKAEVMDLEIKASLNRTRTESETYRVDLIAKAEAEATALKLQADLDYEKVLIEAGWQEETMVCDAAATKHEAGAEKEMSRSFVAKRKHDLDLREKAILASMAGSGNFNLIGTAGDKVVNAMMTGKLQ